jgi:hypothetical protein
VRACAWAGESWVDDVQEGMKVLLTTEAAAAAPVMAISEEAKAAVAGTQQRAAEMQAQGGMGGQPGPGGPGGPGAPPMGQGGYQDPPQGGGGGQGFENFQPAGAPHGGGGF